MVAQEERWLRLFENGVLKRIFEPKRNGVSWEWRKHYEELMICTAHSNCAGDKIEKNEMGGTCSTYGREESSIQGFGGEN